MASESLEKPFARTKHDSNILTSTSRGATLKKSRQVRKENDALLALEKRRKTMAQGGKVRDLSIWGVAEDSIISNAANITSDPIDEPVMKESPTPTKTDYRESTVSSPAKADLETHRTTTRDRSYGGSLTQRG